MKLIINRKDIIDTFAQKTGLDSNQIVIDTESVVGFQPLTGTIRDPVVRDAICRIWIEATAHDAVGAINKVALIKAVRTLTSAALKDSKDFVEDVLCR